MSLIDKNDDIQRIIEDPNLRDAFAELAGVTQYVSNGITYINLSFFANRVASFANSHGQPKLSNVELVKVSSITMPKERAIALNDALTNALKSSSKEGGK